jgi:hypothetical protein
MASGIVYYSITGKAASRFNNAIASEIEDNREHQGTRKNLLDYALPT